MNLKEFIKTLSPEDLLSFASNCDTTPGHLKQVSNGHRRAGEYLAINIERESKGKVRCEKLRPDVDWAYIRGTSAA